MQTQHLKKLKIWIFDRIAFNQIFRNYNAFNLV